MRSSNKVHAALFVVALIALPAVARANPWTRDQGQLYVNLSYATLGASSYYGVGGQKVTIGNAYRQHSLGLYAEVGILDRWLTGVVDATLYRRSSLQGQGFVHGVGDLRLGLRSGLLTWPVRVTVGLTAGIPTGDPDPQPGEGADEAARLIAASLPTGDGEPDFELSVSVGHAFGGPGSVLPLRHYAVAEAGYWFRTSTRADLPSAGIDPDFDDAINWKLEAGVNLPWTVVERIWFIGRVYGSESLAGDDAGLTGFSGLGNGVSHRSYGVEIYARLWRGLGVSVAANGAWSAQGIAAGALYRVALSYER